MALRLLNYCSALNKLHNATKRGFHFFQFFSETLLYRERQGHVAKIGNDTPTILSTSKVQWFTVKSCNLQCLGLKGMICKLCGLNVQLAPYKVTYPPAKFKAQAYAAWAFSLPTTTSFSF